MSDPERPAVRTRVRKTPEERTAEILDAAVAVFAERGYRAADCQEIADRASVGKGTVYRYFDTKEALFLGALEHVMDGLQAHVEAASKDRRDPLEKIRAAVHAYFDYFAAQPEVVELFMQERAEFRERGASLYFSYSEADRGRWVAVLAQLADEGRLRVADPERALRTLGDLAFGAVVSHRLAVAERGLRERAEDVIDTFLHGVLRR